MGISLTLALICAILALAGAQIRALLSQVERLEGQIRDHQAREREITDRMLFKAGYSPVPEREKVLKIPDPEVKQPDFIEEAFRMDAIMEEVEQILPGLKGYDAEFVQQMYPSVWSDAEIRYNRSHANMRL